jgi:CHAP domain
MSVESVLARVATIEQAIANPASLLATAARTGGTAAPAATTAKPNAPAGGPSFAEVLQSASTSTGTPTAGTAEVDAPTLGAPGVVGTTGLDTLLPTQGLPGATGGAGQQIVRVAESQIGQTEQPPGSNESPAIAGYRTATAGAVPGAPWCAYFASWAARQAGEPLGANGEGLGSAAQIASWAQSTGRAIPNGPGVTPQPGDLIVFGDEHVGIVKEVLPNGDIQTIEGNYENKVALNVRTPTEATSYVTMN